MQQAAGDPHDPRDERYGVDDELDSDFLAGVVDDDESLEDDVELDEPDSLLLLDDDPESPFFDSDEDVAEVFGVVDDDLPRLSVL